MSQIPGQVPASRASFGVRFVAALIDGLIVGVVETIVVAVLHPGLGSAVSLLVGLGYFTYLEGSASGQTVGKRALGIRVVDIAGGGPIGPARALARYVGRILSAIPCGLGYWWMLWDPERQTWHDKISSSVVVPAADLPVTAWPG